MKRDSLKQLTTGMETNQFNFLLFNFKKHLFAI